MNKKQLSLLLLGAFLCCMVFPVPALGYVGDLRIADIRSDGSQGDMLGNTSISISDDGRYVAFVTRDGLVDDDDNGLEDVYVRDMQDQITYWISSDSNGDPVNQSSYDARISGNGRYVAFSCGSDNLLAAGDSNGHHDVFVHDRESGTTELVSVSTGGIQGNGDSASPSISDDGRYVAFVSYASNLAAGTSGSYANVYIHDRDPDETLLLSESTGGGEADDESTGPAISGDGQYVAFVSEARDLVVVGGGFAADRKDIYVCDRQGNGMELVSISTAGDYGDGESRYPAISDDGRYVAFDSVATTLDGGDGIRYNVFVRDRDGNQTQIISVDNGGNPGNEHSMVPSFSDNGGYLSFISYATNLVSTDEYGHRDIFVRDMNLNTITLISTNSSGIQGNNACHSHNQCISGNAEYVAFMSLADNLVANDDDAMYDLFVKQIGGASRPASASTEKNEDIDARLAALSTSAGPLTPAFDASVTEYSQSVGSGVASITVTPTAADPRDPTNVLVNGVLVEYGATSGPIALNPGDNTIAVQVNGRRGSTTYTLTVTRGEPNPKTGEYPDYGVWIAAAGGVLLLMGAGLCLRRLRKNRV